MSTEAYVKRVKESARFVEKRMPFKPEVAIILGSGLGGISETLESRSVIPYPDIPGFPVSTAPGHKGELVFGKFGGKNVVLMNGRFHYYEGYSMREVTFPIRVFQLLGVETLVVTNAAGGLNPDFDVGKPMVIVDHINFMGDNPLIGPNIDEWGPRFPDMSEPYDRDLYELALEAAKDRGLPLYKGVYVAVAGPNFETAAEYRMFRSFGADAIGMSTVPEVIVAKHGGMRVLGFSIITDRCVPEEGLKPLSAEEVLEAAEKGGETLVEIIGETLYRMG